VHELAATAGVSPWEYSLRELQWRADERMVAAWDRTAWLAYHIPFTGGRGRWQDYSPLRQAQRAASMNALNNTVAQAKARMPDTLTNDEIDARWAKHKQEQDNAQRR